MNPLVPANRRSFLSTLALGAAAFTTRGLFAEELARVRTPPQTEGPFYPDKLPLDTDNDLLVINDGITPAVGEVTHLTGKILDARGNPVRNALV
jgi:protocatechuate 3,4-dioxygenase beta subunit